MSKENKAYYKQKAKSGEVQISNRPGGSASGGCGSSGGNGGESDGRSGGGNRRTTHGVPVEAYEREERERRREEENMRERINSLIQLTGMCTFCKKQIKKSLWCDTDSLYSIS